MGTPVKILLPRWAALSLIIPTKIIPLTLLYSLPHKYSLEYFLSLIKVSAIGSFVVFPDFSKSYLTPFTLYFNVSIIRNSFGNHFLLGQIIVFYKKVFSQYLQIFKKSLNISNFLRH